MGKCKNEKCNKDLLYNEKYDAYFCKECDVWSEDACKDPRCFYCVGRPEKPSLIPNEIDVLKKTCDELNKHLKNLMKNLSNL